MLRLSFPALVKPIIAQNMSGPPFARATSVTPAKLSFSFHLEDIPARVTEK
jgi:hypothetical protein